MHINHFLILKWQTLLDPWLCKQLLVLHHHCKWGTSEHLVAGSIVPSSFASDQLGIPELTGTLSQTLCPASVWKGTACPLHCQRQPWDSVKVVGLTPLWTPALVVAVFFSFVVLQQHTKAWLFLVWCRWGENVQWTSWTPSAWFVPYVATFLCLLPSFCLQFWKTEPERQFKQWYSGFPVYGSFGNSLLIEKLWGCLNTGRIYILKK